MWPLSRKPEAAPTKRGAKQAQSLKRRRRLSLIIRGGALVVVCLGVITSVYIWKAGLFEKWMTEAQDTVDRKIADAGFVVGEVRITGQENTSLKQIRAALALYDGQSMVSLDLDSMIARVEVLPWVKKVTIIRVLPDALEVMITEHEAAALWQEDGKLYLVDKAGGVITDKGLEKYTHLPQVVGAGANENLTGLLAMKDKYPDLFAKVKSAVWVGQRRWDLNCHNGIKIKLPEKGPDLAWDRLYQYESKQKILTREVLIVDLRLYGKTILRLTPEEAKRRRHLGQNTKKEESI